MKNNTRHQRPFVTLSWGMSLDGKIATYTGDSKYISNEYSRKFVHRLRHESDAILVGINTILIDNPLLTTRLKNGKDAHRIILDTRLKIPLEAKILHLTSSAKTIIVTSSLADSAKMADLKKLGVELVIVPLHDDHVDLSAVMDALWNQGIRSLLVEGGGTIHFAFIEAGLVDRIFTTISPLMIGGEKAKTPVAGQGFETLAKSMKLNPFKIHSARGDIILETTPQKT